MSEQQSLTDQEGSESQLYLRRAPRSASKEKSRSRSRSKKRRHKLYKMSKNRQMTGFEHRFAELAQQSVLVPEEKRIDFVLVHKIKSEDEIEDKEEKEELHRQDLDRAKFIRLLQQEGFTVQISRQEDIVYTKIFCPFKRLCHEAERVKMEMPIRDCQQMDESAGGWLTRFLEKYFETDDEEDFISAPFIMNKIDKYQGHENPNNFFRPAVRYLLTYHILINTSIDKLDDDLKPVESAVLDEVEAPQEKKGLSYMLMKKNYTDYFILHEESIESKEQNDDYMGKSDGQPSPTPEDFELDRDPRKDLADTWTKFTKFQPMWKIRNYFGERIAFYFAWSGMLCSTLWLPMLFGICVFFYGIGESVSASPQNATTLSESFQDLFGEVKQSFDNDATPYFGLFLCIWGTVFLELWKRKNAELAYEWDVEQFESNEPDRPSFSGTKSKKDPVTDEWVWYYPFKRQLMKYWFSFSVLILMIVMVLISVVSVITYRIIINIDYCPDISAAQCLFLNTIVSSVLNAISILILSKVYNLLARWLTDWENHRTQTRYDDALIFKLFAFQFANNYASCFYIAFFQGTNLVSGFLNDDKYKDSCEGSCMTKLSFQVFVLMLIKPMPKFFKDIVLVWIKRLWNKYPSCCLFRCLRKCPCCNKSVNQVSAGNEEGARQQAPEQHSQHMMFLKHEHGKPDLGDFTLDEYMEKIIQYGFLMLFGISLPLAPLLALMTNLVDLRVDARRLLWWYRRPIAFIAQDIGMWYQILQFVNFVGVVTSSFILGFTSDWGSGYNTIGKLIIVISFEHIVFALKYIVSYAIPDTPGHVQLAIRREKYQILKKLEDPVGEIDFSNLYPGDDSGKGGGSRMKSGKGLRGMPSRQPDYQTKPGTYVTYLNANGDKNKTPATGTAGNSQGRGQATWDTVDEVEASYSPGIQRHSAKYRSSEGL